MTTTGPLTTTAASELFRRPPHRWVQVEHGEVAVRSVGEGPDVLLVHGWPVAGATYRGLLPHLTAHVRCHVLDLVGAGESRFDRTARLGVADHAAAVRRVVDTLALDDLAVVGHDSGGLIARHALAGDQRVRGWGLVETEQPQGAGLRFRSFLAVGVLPRPDRVLVPLLTSPRLRRTRAVLGDAFEDRRLLDGEFAEFFLDPLRHDGDRRWALGRFGRDFDLATLDALAGLHRRITVPTRLVYGEHATFFPMRWTREMASGFGGPAELRLIPGGRLFVHEERPHEVAEAVLPALLGRA